MDRILEILHMIHPECDFLSSDDYIEDELLDSFDVIELIDQLETEFQIKIDGLDILTQNVKNIDAIRMLIEKNGGNI